MSDVPELDRLIDEANNVKRNTAWEWQTWLFRRSMGCAFISMLALPVLGLTLGPIGAKIAIVGLLLSVSPVLLLGVYAVLEECFTDPPRRDPTRRYKQM